MTCPGFSSRAGPQSEAVTSTATDSSTRSPYRLFVDDKRDPDFLEFLTRQGSRDSNTTGPWLIVRTQQEA